MNLPKPFLDYCREQKGIDIYNILIEYYNSLETSSICFIKLKSLILSKFNLTEEELYCKSNKAKFVESRQVMWYFLNKNGWSKVRISIMFLKNDHSLVLNGINKIYDRVKFNKQYSEKIHKLEIEVNKIVNT